MSIELSDLITRLRVSVDAPGEASSIGDEEAIARLGTAFWSIRVKGFFTDYRLTVEEDAIVPVTDGADDMPGELQQLVVIQAAITALEGKFSSIDTKFRAKDGETEFETGKTASLLQELLKGRRAELEALYQQIVATPALATNVYAVDLLRVRLDSGVFVG